MNKIIITMEKGSHVNYGDYSVGVIDNVAYIRNDGKKEFIIPIKSLVSIEITEDGEE